jgi:hypothetical protein
MIHTQIAPTSCLSLARAAAYHDPHRALAITGDAKRFFQEDVEHLTGTLGSGVEAARFALSIWEAEWPVFRA